MTKRDRQTWAEAEVGTGTVAKLRERIEELEQKLAKLEELCPPFALVAGQRMADEINRLVIERVIDSRSPAADAALDWKDPDRKRIDEIDELRAQLAEAQRHIRTMQETESGEKATLREQLAEAQRDSERLDWIERVQPDVCWLTSDGQAVPMWEVNDGIKQVASNRLRAAIDDARASGEESTSDD